MVIMRFDFKSLDAKLVYSTSSPSKAKPRKREIQFEGCSNLHCWEDFRKREDFSLGIQAIQPLAVFGARRKNVLRGAGYAWTPDLRVLTNSKR